MSKYIPFPNVSYQNIIPLVDFQGVVEIFLEDLHDSDFIDIPMVASNQSNVKRNSSQVSNVLIEETSLEGIFLDCEPIKV